MADTELYVTKVRTNDGDKLIDYNALANLPKFNADWKKEYGFVDQESQAQFNQATSDSLTDLSGRIDAVSSQQFADKGVLNAICDNLKLRVELLEDAEYLTKSELVSEGYIKEVPVATADAAGAVKPGTGLAVNADGTMSISSVAWDKVTGKPSSYIPATHAHTLEGLSNLEIRDSMPTDFADGKWYLVAVGE